MDFHDSGECDRCGNTIVENVHSEPNVFQIVIRDGEPNTYESHQRVLCDACEKELLKWIDNPDAEFDARVDLPRVDTASQTLDSLGTELTHIADKLAESNGRK